MDIRRLDTFLTVGERSLNHSFGIMLTTSLSAEKSLGVKIQRGYYEASKIEIKTGDKIALSLSLNSTEKVVVFEGYITALSYTTTHIELRAVQSGIKEGVTNETFKDLSHKEAFTKLCPKLEFACPNTTPEQIVLRGMHKESFERLLLSMSLKKPINAWLKRDGTVKIADKIGGGKSFMVDGNLLSTTADSWTIFPIPQLEIGDTLRALGAEAVVRGIILDTMHKAVMICLIN